MTFNSCRFICFIGIDGSGKTTLARSVVSALRRREMDFHYVHGLIYPKLLKPFMAIGRFLFARGKSRESNYREFVIAKRSGFYKHPMLFFPYRALLFLDYFPQVAVKVAIPLLFGRRIVSDRYVFDTIVNMSLNLGYDLNRMIQAVKAYFRVLPKPNVVFLVDLPEEVSFCRKDDVPSIEYLRERRGIYRNFAQAFGMVVLDGTMPVEDLTSIVISTIEEGKGR